MPMSSRFRKILGIATLLGLVFLTGFFINAFYGNPVSALLARNTARQVLEEQFPGEPYTVESCGYNLKTGAIQSGYPGREVWTTGLILM